MAQGKHKEAVRIIVPHEKGTWSSAKGPRDRSNSKTMLLVAAEVEHKDAMDILIEYKGKMKDDNTWHSQSNTSLIKAATNSHTKAGDT